MSVRAKLEKMAKEYDDYGYGYVGGARRRAAPKKKPSAYNKFFAKLRKQDYSAAEIGRMWKKEKKGKGVVIGGRKANMWDAFEHETANQGLTKREMDMMYQKIMGGRKANPWDRFEHSKRKKGLTKKQMERLYRHM